MLAAPLVGHATGARADEPQPDTSSQAQALFDEGRALMEQGNPKEACEKFEASNKVERSAGTLLNLGRCLEAQGKTASALAMYKDTIAVGKAQKKERHVEAAEQFIRDLEPRLSRLTIEVPDPADGITIVRTDAQGSSVTLGDDERGVGLAVDPSTYTVEATAPGHASWRKSVEVDKKANVTVTVPALRPSKTGSAERSADMPFVIAGAATGGVGVVGLVVGAAFGVKTLNDVSEATSNKALCPRYNCTAKGAAFIDDANTDAAVSTATLTIGTAAVLAGTSLVAFGFLHRKAPATGAIVVAPVASLTTNGFFGLVIRGAL